MTEGDTGRHYRRPSPLVLYTLIGCMVVFWSANFTIGKIALRQFDPLLLSGMRTALAALFILPIYFWDRRLRGSASARLRIPLLIFLGVVGVALNQLCFVAGLQRTSVAHSSIMMSLTPLMVLLFSGIAGHERITRRKTLGMAIAMAGVAALQSGSTPARSATLLGDLIVLGAALTFAVYTVAGRKTVHAMGAIPVTTFAYLTGALALSPITIIRAGDFAFAQVTVAGWLSLLYMALFPSMVCYLIYYYALTYIPASRLSAFSYVQPLLATLIALPVIGESITASLIAGGVLVLAGVYVTERT